MNVGDMEDDKKEGKPDSIQRTRENNKMNIQQKSGESGSTMYLKTTAKLKVELKSSQLSKEKPKERAEVHAGHAAKWGISPMSVGTRTKAKEKQKAENDSREKIKKESHGTAKADKKK